MKFTTTAGALRDALDHVTKVVPAAPSQVVYTGVRLRVREGELTVTGSDEGAVTVTITVPITDATSGSKVLLPKPLIAYLATLRANTPVQITAATGPELTVTANDSAPYTFRLMESTFPNTAAPTDNTYTTDLSRLPAAVKAVKDAATKSRLVQVASTPHGLYLHATDGLRLARACLPEANLGTFTGLLPLEVLTRIGDHHITDVSIDRRGRVVTASGATTRIIARVADDMFPNVGSILDHLPPHEITVPTRALLQSLTRLAAIADKRPVIVTVDGDQLRMTADSDSIGSGQEVLDLEHPSDAEITFGVNLEFFHDALSAHTAPDVTLGWSEPVRPVFVRSDDPLPVTTVVQPLKFL